MSWKPTGLPADVASSPGWLRVGQLNQALTFASFQTSRKMQGATWTVSSGREGREIYGRKRLGARKLQQKYWHPQSEGGGGGRQEKESFQEKNICIRYFQK